MMPPQLIGQVAALLEQHAGADIATLASRITSVQQLLDPGIVKVVTDAQGRALYFSRAPIPWDRDAAPASLVSQRSFTGARRHVGLYAYRVAALRRMSMLQPGRLELIERLEQLRALENGLEVRVGDASAQPGPHVDTPEDLARVRVLMNRA
jgi:3-deoxy-manno-octulosonate cytidylyltransferase (CMP-KDO synthetase)